MRGGGRLKELLKIIFAAFFAMATCARGVGQLYPVPGQSPAQTARVQQMLATFSTPGKWDTHIKWMGSDSLYDLDKAGARGMSARRILQLLQSAQFLNPPQGFEVQVHLMGVGEGPLDFHHDDVGATGWHPGAFRMGLDLFPGSAKQAGETGIHIIIDVNFIPATSNPGISRGTQALKPVAVDSAGPILRGPSGGARQIGSFGGFPLYQDGTIVLTRNREPLYVPVTREEYLRAMISDYQGKSQLRGSGYSPVFAAPLETALARMSSTERSLQAWIGCRGPGTLCDSNDALLNQTTPLQRVNRRFFDPNRAVDSVQLITIRMAHTLDPYAQYLFQHIWDSLDWDALARILQN